MKRPTLAFPTTLAQKRDLPIASATPIWRPGRTGSTSMSGASVRSLGLTVPWSMNTISLTSTSTPGAPSWPLRSSCEPSACKVGMIGHVLPFRHPIQTAEEFAQLDILSGGRFIGRIVRGVPQEYISFNVDPFTGRERFAETYEILHT